MKYIRSHDLFVIDINNIAMKVSVLQRVNDIISNYSISKNAFSNKIGMEQTTVNNQLLGKRSISIDLILSTLNSFPEVSAEWLLRGTGEMLLTENQPQQKESPQKFEAEIELDEDGYLRFKLKK